MRILFDNVAFDIQGVGGVSRYCAELMDAIRKNELARVEPSFFFTTNQHLRDKRFPTIWSVPGHLRWRSRINNLTTRVSVVLKNIDIFHMTFYDISLVNLIRCPFVVNLYDMIPEVLPHFFGNPLSIHPGKRELCEKAHAVISGSYNSKADLVRLFGIDPEKIFVTHYGIDQQWSQRASSVSHLPERFILYVGNRAGYKNFGQLIESMGRLSRRYADLHLVCAGGPPFDKREHDMLQIQSLFQRVHRRAVSDPELAYCYMKAAACVFPSLYEGFGFPILESFLSRCPLILSNRSCFPEIAGDAAEYFDPDSSEALDDAIDRVLHDRDHRLKLIKRGINRVSNYTWHNTALKTAAVYRKLQ